MRLGVRLLVTLYRCSGARLRLVLLLYQESVILSRRAESVVRRMSRFSLTNDIARVSLDTIYG